MNNRNPGSSFGDLEVFQARYALRVAARLSEGSRDLPHDISERLRAVREQAVGRAGLARRAHAATSTQTTAARSAAAILLGLPGSSPRAESWLKLASVIPVVALVAGFMLIDRLHTRSQIKTAAEIDTALLADHLPPAAYSDPGFVEFLKIPPQ